MKDFFKAKDFAINDPEIISVDKFINNEKAAKIANEKLNALIESWPVVYNYNEGLSSWWNPKEMVTTADNPVRKARLAFIEEIIKQPCKHDSYTIVGFNIGVCNNCNAKLVAEWREK